uniref:Uncharacterized protein n=1 Tax=Arundo donax TaxID=35708 RepID=A0A0A9DAA7_ARUDO
MSLCPFDTLPVWRNNSMKVLKMSIFTFSSLSLNRSINFGQASRYIFDNISGRDTIIADRHFADALRTFQLASSSSVYSFALSSSSSSSWPSSSVSSSMISVKLGS